MQRFLFGMRRERKRREGGGRRGEGRREEERKIVIVFPINFQYPGVCNLRKEEWEGKGNSNFILHHVIWLMQMFLFV
jgi:hypothetical protein